MHIICTNIISRKQNHVKSSLSYEDGLKSSLAEKSNSDILSAICNFFDQLYPSTATIMEDMQKQQKGQCLKKKTWFHTFYGSILINLRTFQLILVTKSLWLGLKKGIRKLAESD